MHTSKTGRWRVIRLLLGDGELCIQALLSGDMHRYIDSGEVAVGTYIQLETFRIESIVSGASSRVREKEEDMRGMVYLIVDDLAIVGWNNKLLNMLDQEERAPRISEKSVDQEYKRGESMVSNEPRPYFVTPKIICKPPDPQEEVADADDDFEVMTVSESKTTQKRAEIAGQRASTGYLAPVDSNHLPWSSTDPTRPLKLTPLGSVPNLPYKQNWSINILAVISAISDVEPSALPPFSQRQARLTHPSTPKHVHLTVFLDAEDFAPEVGSVVLLLGVKNHRFDGGSVKKYVSDRPKDGGRWWFKDPTQLEWCDVEGLKKWWRSQ